MYTRVVSPSRAVRRRRPPAPSIICIESEWANARLVAGTLTCWTDSPNSVDENPRRRGSEAPFFATTRLQSVRSGPLCSLYMYNDGMHFMLSSGSCRF